MEYANESAQCTFLRALGELDRQLTDLAEAFKPASVEEWMGTDRETDQTSDGEK